MNLRNSAALLTGLVIASLVHPVLTHAESLVPGISVSPGQLTLQVDASGQQSTNFAVSNDYSVAVSFSAALEGIDEQSDRLLPVGPVAPDLAKTLHLSQTDFIVPAHSSTNISVSVSDSQQLSPGGHYASVVLTEQQAGSRQLGLRASIGLSLFVLKPAGAIVKLNASKLTANGWLFHLPNQASIQFSNKGNIHTVPRALISVMHGKTILATGIANQVSLPLLPGSLATSIAPITTQLRSIYFPADIHIIAAYRPDGSDQVKTISVSQLYIPPFYPIALFVIIAGFITIYRKRRINMHKPTAVEPVVQETVPEVIAPAIEAKPIVNPDTAAEMVETTEETVEPSKSIALQTIEDALLKAKKPKKPVAIEITETVIPPKKHRKHKAVKSALKNTTAKASDQKISKASSKKSAAKPVKKPAKKAAKTTTKT